MDRSEREAFFAGYATCTAFPDVYEWFEGGWLASLEGALGATWPTERAESWGHFPYLDAPGPWTSALEALMTVM